MKALLGALLAVAAASAPAQPASREHALDGVRDFPSRDLRGLAVREDGRLVAGPFVRELAGDLPGIAWCIAPLPDGRWLIGSGPDGRILRADLSAGESASIDTYAQVGSGSVYALHVLEDGAVLAAVSPESRLVLLREGAIVARLPLPVENLLALVPDRGDQLLLGTGGPARLYRVDPVRLAAAGVVESAPSDSLLASSGVTRIAEVFDQNLRCLLPLEDGTVLAGSAPRARIYRIEPRGSIEVLYDGGEGEFSALLRTSAGRILAALTSSRPADADQPRRPTALGQGMSVVSTAGRPAPSAPPEPEPQEPEDNVMRFRGRGRLLDVTPGRFPELLFEQTGRAVYALAELGGWVIVSAGERGELFAYDPDARRAYLIAGTSSAQNVALAPHGDGLLVLRSSFAGLARLAWSGGSREFTTRAVTLPAAARLGRLRLDAHRGFAAENLRLEFQVSVGGSEPEAWSPWQEAPVVDGAHDLGGGVARRIRLRGAFSRGVERPEVARFVVHFLPQNRRPELAYFRLLPPNLGLLPNPERANQPFTPLGQLLGQTAASGGGSSSSQPNDGRPRGASGFLGSPVVARPGVQLVVWNVTDSNDYPLLHSLALRPFEPESATWIPVVTDTRESYAEINTLALPEGRYELRLRSRQEVTRPDGALEIDYTDDALVIDRTPPLLRNVELRILDRSRAAVSAEVVDTVARPARLVLRLDNGQTFAAATPLDGILDGTRETFRVEFPPAALAGATSVEVTAEDGAGNAASLRLDVPADLR